VHEKRRFGNSSQNGLLEASYFGTDAAVGAAIRFRHISSPVTNSTNGASPNKIQRILVNLPPKLPWCNGRKKMAALSMNGKSAVRLPAHSLQRLACPIAESVL
jgi:hypothetical protein